MSFFSQSTTAPLFLTKINTCRDAASLAISVHLPLCVFLVFVCVHKLVEFLLRGRCCFHAETEVQWFGVRLYFMDFCEHSHLCVCVSKRRQRNTVDVAAGLEFPLVCHALTNKYTHTHCHVTLPLQCREGRRKGLSPHCSTGILLKSNVCCVLGASAQHQVLKESLSPKH